MNIDWFTFAAQIVNFLVLVALLRWLLYGRILRAMKVREEKIANRLKEAERKHSEAEEKVEQYEEKTREIDRRREELLEEARREAREEHERLLKEARREVDRKRDQWQQAYHRELDDLLSDLRRQAGKMGVEAARRTLVQLAETDLDKRMCDTFAARMRELGEEQRREIRRHLGNGDVEVSIRSAFDVSNEQKQRLRETIRETFGYGADISFETSTDLICGLELDVGGYRFGWNVREFLHDLEHDFDERLKSARYASS